MPLEFFFTWFASGCATVVGVLAAILLSRLPHYRTTEPPPLTRNLAEQTEPPTQHTTDIKRTKRWQYWVVLLFWLTFVLLLMHYLWSSFSVEQPEILVRSVFSSWILPVLVGSVVLYGWSQNVKVYESLVEGAKQGFEVALRIIPYLVTILVAVGMFRASGGIDVLVKYVGPLTSLILMPVETLPMALFRPLTGSGAYGLMALWPKL